MLLSNHLGHSKRLYLGSNLVQNPNDLTVFPVYDLHSNVYPIGGMFSLTSSLDGLVIPASIQRMEAFRCQIAAINQGKVLDNNGNVILKDTTIAYSIYDTQLSASAAVSSAINLLGANFTSVIGKRELAKYFWY